MSVKLSQKQAPSLALKPHQMLGLKLLTKSLPELRAEIAREMSANPAIEEMDHPLETSLGALVDKREREDYESDYPEDDFEPGANLDEAAAERRQAFFDNQVEVETLQAHLLGQLPLSEIAPSDWPIVEVLVGDLNDDGFYTGSIADVAMAFGRPLGEIEALLAAIGDLDPVGCGARTAKECLLAQLDKTLPYYSAAKTLIEAHLELLAAKDLSALKALLKVDDASLKLIIAEILKLDPHPGRRFPGESSREEYINPEIHSVKIDGYWYAQTDKRSLPEIRISSSFEAMLTDKTQSEETRSYVKERIESAKILKDAIVRRQETVEAIAQAIFDKQQAFFEQGFAALKPLTELAIAEEAGVDPSTVSRTVRDKYAKTPFGTVELRRFFVTGVTTASGEVVAQDAVLNKLKALIESEKTPLSDEKLSEQLKLAGFSVARRTVAKYRERLRIKPASQR